MWFSISDRFLTIRDVSALTRLKKNNANTAAIVIGGGRCNEKKKAVNKTLKFSELSREGSLNIALKINKNTFYFIMAFVCFMFF